MAIAKVQTVSGSATSGSSVKLGSWSPGANELILLAVAMRENGITPTASGNGITFTPIADVTQAQNQFRIVLFRGMKSNPSTGQITVTINTNTKPVIAVASRFSGVDISGTNGSGAVEAYTSTAGPASDDANMHYDITTLADAAWAFAFGSHRSKTFAVPEGETAISINNQAGASGDVVTVSTWYQEAAIHGTVTLGADGDLDNAGDWAMALASIKPAPTNVTVSPESAVAKTGVAAASVVYGSLSISPLYSSVGSAIVNPVVDIASLPVVVSPGSADAVTSILDPEIVQSDADLAPSPAGAAAAVTGPGVLVGIPVTPVSPAMAVAARVNPELTFTSIAFAPDTPASVAVSSIAPTVRVVNVTVVPMTLTSRPKMTWSILPRPAVYLDDQILLEDLTGSWLFEDHTHIISGLGRGAQLVISSRSLGWHLNKRYGNND